MQAPSPEKPKDCRVSLLRTAVAFALGFILVGGRDSSQAKAQLQDRSPELRVSQKEGFSFEPVKPKLTVLERVQPYLPEWLAMVAEIADGGQLQPGRGWFVRGKSFTKFPWEAVAARLDQDHNGSISRQEFPGLDHDFRRLDRDTNGRLTGVDFEFPQNALERSRSRMIMSFADSNHDGKIKGDEYSRMIFLGTRDLITRNAHFADAISLVEKAYEDSVKEGLPYLSSSDLRGTVDLSAKLKSLMAIPDIDGDFERAPKATLSRALVNREIGAVPVGPSLGDRAPDFTLPTEDGRVRMSLSKLLGKRPLVLIFANYTSPSFRVEAGTLEKLYQRYRGRAEFLLVYVREEHPTNGWISKENSRLGIAVVQPVDDRRRAAVAQQCRKKLGLTLPMVVDLVDDRVGILYSGMPDRLYLLDSQGAVAYKGGRGPFGFKPDELEQSLLLLLQAEAASTPAASGTAPLGEKAATR